MPAIIDKELEKAIRDGKTPKRIYLGLGLYDEIRNEQFAGYAGDIVADEKQSSVFPTEEPKEYRGIRLHVVEDKDPQYLQIET